MLPERGEGCRCKGKTPKTFMYVLCIYHPYLLYDNDGMAYLLFSVLLPSIVKSNSIFKWI